MKNTLPEIFCILLFLTTSCQQTTFQKPEWPVVARETKPWSRWWWHGSSVTKEGITAEMEAYKKAGLGGLEITPIYGVFGDEKNFVDYLSPQWMELFLHTLREAERLDMGIDMATGTGWPFGGPWVSDADACKAIEYKIYEVKAGESIKEKIEFIQQPFLRAVGNSIYEGKDPATAVMRVDPKKIDINRLSQPVHTNKNLQDLALDQVKFERSLTLRALRAYNETGEVVELMDKITDGKLNWTAPQGTWKVYAVFEGSHGKMVERAGPGGEGNVIDHFSSTALKNYLSRFDSAMAKEDIRSLRAFFNDSYEVDDARGAADWTPDLFAAFKEKQGYDLRDYIPNWLGKGSDTEMNERVLSDYRETVSELVLNNFTLPWKSWAHEKDAIIRNQAHGSPSNILDLYAAVDIPEIEGTESLRIKMASSAGNVTGKKLVSSESATWLDEHFQSNLGDVKGAVDLFFLNGVNHIFYHGTCYSPAEEPWPGRLFYAAVHLNPRNSLWPDFDALNMYVTRCQSLLQQSHPDNDVLLYFPIYDRFAVHSEEMIEHFDGIGKQFEGTSFRKGAETMHKQGYTFDFISDKQIGNLSWSNNRLFTEGKSQYKTLVIPHCRYIPVKTLEKISALAQEGATIIFYEGLPESFSGMDGSRNKEKFSAMVKGFSGNGEGGGVRNGKVIIMDNLREALSTAGVEPESMVRDSLQYIRKITDDHVIQYFISNTSSRSFDGWIMLKKHGHGAVLLDPMTSEIGKAHVKEYSDSTAVYVQLQPAQSVFINLYDDDVETDEFTYYRFTGDSVSFNGTWNISFTAGGPVLPEVVTTDSLCSWTKFKGEGYETFSGTAAYRIEFDKPVRQAESWLLDLGNVHESAEVSLNGKLLGKLIGPVYQLQIDPRSLLDKNTLVIKVSNLMANRIIDLDKRNVLWKKFYNINFPARKAENRVNGLFNASQWRPEESGLIGPVRLKALETKIME
ncbi:MAG TPA: glycosyl hydrolase [Ohtaekwangia sp.]